MLSINKRHLFSLTLSKRKNIPPLTASFSQSQHEIIIDDVHVKVKPLNPEYQYLVPNQFIHKFGKEALETNEILDHLRWISQKYSMGQDIFLCGHPTSLRRNLSFLFAEICGLEVEYLSISKDTTESDLKQRKEIIKDSVIYHDQAPIRAAIHGRLLIIDGMEKAERNVLPTLNNLLENREMALEDGRFLTMRPLPKDNNSTNLIQVHPDFRVIALGIPVPPYPGRTIDPPLRSRFQSRFIEELQPETLLALQSVTKHPLNLDTTNKLLQFYESIRAIKQKANQESFPLGDVPTFSIENFQHCTQLLSKFGQNITIGDAIARSSPGIFNLNTFSNPRFNIEISLAFNSIADYQPKSSSNEPLSFEKNIKEVNEEFKLLPNNLNILKSISMDHICGKHICIFGDKGSGKSHVAQAFAKTFNYKIRSFPLYQELTSRDLLQRRCTSSEGDSSWLDSPLITAARNGDLCILDGVNRIDSQALSTLSRFFQDGEIDLPNGERLTYRRDTSDLTPGTFINPNFRVLALGLLPESSVDARDRWLISDLGFSFHYLAPLTNKKDIDQFVEQYIRSHTLESNPHLDKLLDIGSYISKAYHELINQSEDTSTLKFSLRHVLRLLQTITSSSYEISHSSTYNKSQIVDLLRHMLLIQFSNSNNFDSCMVSAGLLSKNNSKKSSTMSAFPSSQNHSPLSIHVNEEKNLLSIGSVHAPRRIATSLETVPHTLFYENPLHIFCLQQILKDFFIENRSILLIGNQGVGKNKLIDKLLELLNAEREYIQLHRDTSIHSLTVIPTIEKGKIIYEDSPLIKAAKYGRVLVVDEADKADNSVVCILKALAEDGELVLYDGRRLLSQDKIKRERINTDKLSSEIIPIHPDFKLIVLANRPGFPFLGNNFFRECGDVFSTHVIGNLDRQSELALLSAYGPDVNKSIIKNIVNSFNALREAHDANTLAYPFSAREAVSVVKHLQKFPQDSVIDAVENILGFDGLSFTVRKNVAQIFQDNGIPVALERKSTVIIKPPAMINQWKDIEKTLTSKFKPNPLTLSPTLALHGKTMKKIDWKTSIILNNKNFQITSSRVHAFTEEIGYLNIEKNEAGDFPGTIVDMKIVSGIDAMFVLTNNPVELHVYTGLPSEILAHFKRIFIIYLN